MPTFVYEALDQAGAEFHDSIDAPNEAEAITRLRGMGRYVTRIVESEAGRESVSTAKAKRRIRRAFHRD